MTLDHVNWLVVAVVFVYCYVVLYTFYSGYKNLVRKDRKKRKKELESPLKEQQSKFEEKGEVVCTNIVHMSERLKVENVDKKAKPYWPLRERE